MDTRVTGVPRKARGAVCLLAMACCTVVVGACGASRTSSPRSSVAQHHLEADVLAVMNHNGIPVMDSYIACKVIPDGHTQTCLGQSDNAGADEIDAYFDIATTASSHGSCPGSLTVTLDSVQVDKVQVDPCR